MAAYTAVDDSGSFFKTKLFTGTGSSLGVTGVGFQPDFTWIKNRDAADFHVLTDAVRGVTKYLESNSTNAEVTDVQSLKTFDSDGFTVGTMAQVNTNTEDYVSWNWKAGTTTGIAGSPSITPTSYSFNATSGFSIIEYTGNGSAGATLPHGLGVIPTFIIVRELGSSYWVVYHEFMGPTKYMYLNETTGAATNTNKWNDTAPTTTLFSLGNSGEVNDTTPMIAYCFTDVQGYSKFGSYVGNGNANGTFVYLGFQPAYVVLKRTDSGDDWLAYDNKRPTFYDPNLPAIKVNDTAGDTSLAGFKIDFLGSGFKLRGTDATINSSGGDYIYIAFADQSFVNSNGVPCTAR